MKSCVLCRTRSVLRPAVLVHDLARVEVPGVELRRQRFPISAAPPGLSQAAPAVSPSRPFSQFEFAHTCSRRCPLESNMRRRGRRAFTASDCS